MRVTISVLGRFHAFYLAHQLYKHEHLAKLITSYPTFEAQKYGILQSHITTLLSHELIRRGWYKLPSGIIGNIDLQYYFNERFDKTVAKRIPERTQIFVGWSGASLHSMKQAKVQGGLTILERGSSHIEFQHQILSEEYEYFGISRPSLPHPKIVEKELIEYDFADYICVPSGYVKRTFLEKNIPEGKILCIPYGVDLTSFRQLPKEDNIFRVIFAGGMNLRKGVHYLLQAFAELDLPNAELWLVGAKTEEIEPFFEKYATDKVKYLGYVAQNRLHEYYSQCSVFAICSIEEGLALVQPQAMACGLPLICTEHTGGSDLVNEGKEGFVLPIRDVNAIKQTILHLYEDRDLCTEMGLAAKKRVQSGFTWDDYGDKIIEAYGRILEKERTVQ